MIPEIPDDVRHDISGAAADLLTAIDFIEEEVRLGRRERQFSGAPGSGRSYVCRRYGWHRPARWGEAMWGSPTWTLSRMTSPAKPWRPARYVPLEPSWPLARQVRNFEKEGAWVQSPVMQEFAEDLTAILPPLLTDRDARLRSEQAAAQELGQAAELLMVVRGLQADLQAAPANVAIPSTAIPSAVAPPAAGAATAVSPQSLHERLRRRLLRGAAKPAPVALDVQPPRTCAAAPSLRSKAR